MDINEANLKLLRIGNAVIIGNYIRYRVTPRVCYNLKDDSEYKEFTTVEDAYNYAKELPTDWE